jgi:CDP-glycerol glycerophosphotransferase (TagB/SpsB family)
MFPEIFQDMLAFASEHPNLDVVMRPHPIMFGILIEQEIVPEDVLSEWLKKWRALPNTAIDHESDIGHLFAAADLFVTDGISFLGEYPIATGKPAIFFDKAGHWPWSPLGGLASAANIHVRDFAGFAEVFNEIFGNGMPDFSSEIDTLRDAAQPYPGEAAKKIVEVILSDYEERTPLVNKALIKEVAWENRPGTEAAWPN